MPNAVPRVTLTCEQCGGRFADTVKALLAAGPGCHCDGAGCAHCQAEALLKPARKHQPFEYDVEPEATQCH